MSMGRTLLLYEKKKWGDQVGLCIDLRLIVNKPKLPLALFFPLNQDWELIKPCCKNVALGELFIMACMQEQLVWHLMRSSTCLINEDKIAHIENLFTYNVPLPVNS